MCERDQWVFRFFFVVGTALAISQLGMACARPEKPACSSKSLAELEAEYVAESLQACAGQTRATCAAMPGIEKKYETKREAWIQCR